MTITNLTVPGSTNLNSATISNATVNNASIKNADMIKTDKLQFGNKWLISATGDMYANDEWLRFMTADGKGYAGFAAQKLWTSDNTINGRNIFSELDGMRSDKRYPGWWVGGWDVGNGEFPASIDECIAECKRRPGALSASWRNDNRCWCKSIKATGGQHSNHTMIIFDDR